MLCEVTKEWDWMEGGDRCPVTKLAASLRRDLDPMWFENINEYQAGNVMGGGKKEMGSDRGFQINSLGDALIYPISPEQRNPERFPTGNG